MAGSADLGWLRQFGSVAPVIEGDVSYRPAGGPVERMRVLGIDILRDRPFRDYRLLQWTGGTGQPRPQEFLELLIDPASGDPRPQSSPPPGSSASDRH